VFVDLRPKLDLLDQDDLLVLLGLSRPLRSWVLGILPKSMMRQTGGTAVGEISTRSRPFCLAMASALRRRHDAELGTRVVDDADLPDPDAFVDAYGRRGADFYRKR
jgi:hypothetical protein